MRNLKIVFAAAALLSAPAFAADEAGQAPKVAEGDKIVCKVDKTTGSAISERVCKKRSKWEAERDAAKRFFDHERRQNFDPRTMPSRGGG